MDTNPSASEAELPPGEGGTMHYGGTDAAYEGMEDPGEGDAGDRAVGTDRDDLRGPSGHLNDAGAPTELGHAPDEEGDEEGETDA